MPVGLENCAVSIEVAVVGLLPIGGFEDCKKFREEIDQHAAQYRNFSTLRKAA
jgi:hypothetical protein